MIFIDKMKNFKIYKTQMFLPTLADDKKKGSAILLLTPNYNSSKKLLDYPLFVNRLRYASYYIERNISYYIGKETISEVDDDVEDVEESTLYENVLLEKISYKERKELDDSEFGLPEKRKYPLNTEANVRSAVKLFNYVDKEDEKELADNINKAIKKFNITNIHPGENNRFSKYFNESTINYFTEDLLRFGPKDSLNLGDKVMIFNENTTDVQLKKILYRNRMRKRSNVMALFDQVKIDFPFIKYTFPELNKYKRRNLFVDLYFYNNVFFQNNNWVMKRGMNLYLEFMDRLINNPNIKEAGYTKKTIFIPIIDWDTNHNYTVWNYRESLNPLSVLYYLMFYESTGNRIKNIFGNTDLVFIGKDKYFKINFSQIETKDIKKLSVKFKNFLIKICKNEEFEADDVDTTADNSESPEVVKAKIIDKIELSKGVDLTKAVADADKEKKEEQKITKKEKPSLSVNHVPPLYSVKVAGSTATKGKQPTAPNRSLATPANKVKLEIPKPIEVPETTISKITLNTPKVNNISKKEKNIKVLAKAISDIDTSSEDEALNDLDDDEIKKILIDLDSESDGVDISAGRAARATSLDQQLMDKEIKGRTVREILEPSDDKKDKTEKTELNIATPNEDWKELTFVNFDKNYDIDKDIISCFKHLSTTSRPISIKDISVSDNSTSEDRVELYRVELEDYRGKRFTVKVDIPIMVDNRFLLRGNNKTIQTQFFNMPIIKTDFDTCQIISNYKKIFVRKFNSNAGKSLPQTSRLLKVGSKSDLKSVKFIRGNNGKISAKYNLPIDYIDLGNVFSKVETSKFTIYFNQDEIRSLYNIDEGKGIPYLYDKKTKEIEYIPADNVNYTFTNEVVNKLYDYQDFAEAYSKSTPTKICSYSRCSIMSTEIPLVVVCAYHEGLRKVLEKGSIKYKITATLTKEDRDVNANKDWIKFRDGYVIYDITYESSLLLNGLKACPTDLYEIADIDNRSMYLEFLDEFGGRIKSDGLDNFYDLMVDPMTKEVLEFYKFPTDYVSILLYANALLADNKFIKHTDTSSRRLRRYEIISAYTYMVLAEAFESYSNQLKHSREAAEFIIKQSAVIDKFLSDSITADDSCINALRDVEATNEITTKGPSGMNSARAYSLDKRTYDDSMLNILGMSTGFAGNVGITRQATIDANVDPNKGYVKSIDGDTEKMNSSKSLTATEALTPFGTTHDDPMRTAMTFIQTAKHEVRTEDSDPLLVTNGADEAMPWLTSDRFAFKAKKDGIISEVTDDYIIIAYDDGTKDYVSLKETIEKNSDGGYYVPLKLDIQKNIKVKTRITKNQIIAYDKYSFSNSVGETDNIAYNIGKLAKVAIVNSDEGFEDSGIITERMAKKLATRINLKYDVVIDKDSNIFKFAKVGDHVECGDPLVIWQAPFDDEDANALLKSLSREEVSDLGKRKLKSEVTGTVKDVKIYRTVEVEELSESLGKIVKDYEAPLIALDAKLKENNLDTSKIPAHYILPANGKLKKAENAVLVEFFVEFLDTVGIGDKVVYFSANKAVEKNVIPLGKEPYTAFRPNEPIDAFVSEVSIDKRMVTSTPIYGSLQKLMIELDRSVKDIMGIPYDDSTV
jgi:hypothetical protein